MLLLLALLAPVSLAQTPLDDAAYPTRQALTDISFLPGGIAATGDTTEVRALYSWADEHQHSHPIQAEEAAQRALARARELNDPRGIGESLIVLGHLSFPSNLGLAETYYTEAQGVLEQAGDEHALIRNRINFGNIRKEQGALREALMYYFEALEEFERLDDTEGQVRVLNNIGIAYEHHGDLREALTYYQRAVALAETLDDPNLLTHTLNSVGVILSRQGSYESAEAHLRRGLTISEERDSRRSSAIISNNLGFLFNKQGRHRQALTFLLAAERLAKELEEDGLLIAVYDELGKAYLRRGWYDDAFRYARESLALAQETGLVSRQMDAHETLSQIYETVGNPLQALVHYREYAAAKDSVFNTEKAEIITEMQTRYETEEKQRAIERLEQENQIQALRQTLLLGGIIFAFLIAGLFYNRYRLKRKANRLLEELDTAKSRFFANISHEFRTPLTVILGGLQDTIAGRFGNVSGKLADQQRVMLHNSRRLHRLIDEVLDLNRLESGKLELKPIPGDLVRSLQRTVEANAPLAERNGISLTFKHEVENCPRLFDEEKLEKIVGNLLSNALKFTPRGKSVHVNLRCGEGVAISVTDTGTGIPAEAQEKIFERFAQLEGSELRSGTGIGLALAKELTELHGGTIILESAPGEGSTFTVRLPLEETTLDDVQSTIPLRGLPAPQGRDGDIPTPQEKLEVGGDLAPPSEESEEESDLSRRSEAESDRTAVLIIEDNDDVRAYIRRSLEETYHVLEIADGEAGLQQARAELPDLIVSDVMLPGIDGYEIARRLKTEPATECIPVVMLTARAAEEDQTEGYGSGAEVYITKPFSPETLRAAIVRLLEERKRLRRRLQENAKQEKKEERTNGHPTLSDHARSVLLEHIYDEKFGAKELASALNMTRRTLYNRLKSEVDLSPSDFIRIVRLEQARELLSKGTGSVSEVAYAVGFNSLAVFSRNYSAHYGTPPSTHLSTD